MGAPFDFIPSVVVAGGVTGTFKNFEAASDSKIHSAVILKRGRKGTSPSIASEFEEVASSAKKLKSEPTSSSAK